MASQYYNKVYSILIFTGVRRGSNPRRRQVLSDVGGDFTGWSPARRVRIPRRRREPPLRRVQERPERKAVSRALQMAVELFCLFMDWQLNKFGHFRSKMQKKY